MVRNGKDSSLTTNIWGQKQLSLLAPASGYVEPAVSHYYESHVVVGNYGMQGANGYQELQVMANSKHTEYVLLYVSKDYSGVLAYLPATKLRWHKVASTLRGAASKIVQADAAYSAAMDMPKAKQFLYRDVYNACLHSISEYYSRQLELAHRNLLNLTETGKSCLLKKDLQFIATIPTQWHLSLDFALFVLSKMGEHYRPQRFDYMPKLRRDFVRCAKYQFGTELDLTSEALTKAILVGAATVGAESKGVQL